MDPQLSMVAYLVVGVALLVAALCVVVVRGVRQSRVLLAERLPTADEVEAIATAMRRPRNLTPIPDGETGAERCPICLESPTQPLELIPCGHTLCTGCFLMYWGSIHRRGRVTCPLDRGVVELAVPLTTAGDGAGPRRDALHRDVHLYNTGYINRSSWRATLRTVILSFTDPRLVLRVRVGCMLAAVVLYIALPFDLLPEAAYGVFGLLDDLVVVWLFVAIVASAYVRNMQVG
jgi:RING finger protein 170